jgi:hypothetical protein
LRALLRKSRQCWRSSGPPQQPRAHPVQLAAEVEQLQACSDELKAKQTEQEQQIAAPKAWTGMAIDSRIVSSFPPLFDEFRPKRFALLYTFSITQVIAMEDNIHFQSAWMFVHRFLSGPNFEIDESLLRDSSNMIFDCHVGETRPQK